MCVMVASICYFFCLVVFDLGDALLYCEVVCRCRV